MALQTDHQAALAARIDARRQDPDRDFTDAVWAARIRRALDDQRLELASETLVPLAGGAAREQLRLRLIGDDGAPVDAEALLPVAEKFGLVAPLDRWVVAKAVRFAAVGRIVHVSLSAASVHDVFMTDLIAHELCAAGAPAANVVFELSAGALMSSADGGEAFAARLHALGCGLALRDVAPDHTSPCELGRLRVQALTINRGIVRDLRHGWRDRCSARAIVSLAHGLGVETIAVGVSCRETLALLRRWGVDYAQCDLLPAPAGR
jgi:EAL domain-containing protein (putative c-di-GMP-specific phosphodiesterase class I)